MGPLHKIPWELYVMVFRCPVPPSVLSQLRWARLWKYVCRQSFPLCLIKWLSAVLCVSEVSSVFDISFCIPSVCSPHYRIPMECTGIWHAGTKDSGSIADQLHLTAVLSLSLFHTVSSSLYCLVFLMDFKQVMDLSGQGVCQFLKP